MTKTKDGGNDERLADVDGGNSVGGFCDASIGVKEIENCYGMTERVVVRRSGSSEEVTTSTAVLLL
jgi:hypothetical protein